MTDIAAKNHVDLDVEGMTCASCAARIEKRLNRIDGVQAAVNFATDRASVDLADGIAVNEVLAAVESTGYHARPVASSPSAESASPADGG